MHDFMHDCYEWLETLGRFDTNILCIFLWFWTLFMYVFVLPVQSHEGWHIVLFYYVVQMSRFLNLSMSFSTTAYAQKYFWWRSLQTRDLILVMVWSLYHGVSASTFSSSCVVSYCLCCCLMSISNFYCGSYHVKPAMKRCWLCI